MTGFMQISHLGENTLLLQFKEMAVEMAHSKIMQLHRQLTAQPFVGFVESVPAYDSIAIIYDITKMQLKSASFTRQIQDEVEKYLTKSTDITFEGTTHIIPVKYGGTYGPDLETVAEENGISPSELISLHTERIYPVFMLGFAGGFPYLGFTHEKLFTNRKKLPMQSVPAGSVALAGNQTGIYPFETPGAWKIIGHTSYCIFDIHKKNPAIIQPGDKIKFVRD